MPNINIEAAAVSLGLHQRVYDRQIRQETRVGMETEASLTQVRCMTSYVAPNAEIGDILQAYQGDHTPNLSLDFNAVQNDLQRLKIDILFEPGDIDQFYDSWMAEWVEDGRERNLWTFPRYIYSQIIQHKLEENMETVSYKGVFVAPTPGLPGVTMNAVDGIKKKVGDAITAGLLTPIATGPFVANTMVNQVESFCDAIPIPYRDQPGIIRMSKTNARKYNRDYRTLFGTAVGNMGNENSELRVDATNKVIRGFASMEGDDGMIFTPARNAIVGRRIGEPILPSIRWQVVDRKLKGLAEFSRFFGFRFWGNTFVNDQV